MIYPRPEIFISATTCDLGSCRKMIKEALITLGCSPIEQTNFPPAAGLVREMLRQRISSCHAVIHVVGEAYGAEPQQRSDNEPRRSYTQMEYDIACELGKDVYTFICDQAFPYDTHPPEDEEHRALQQLHREKLYKLDALYEPITSREQLEKRIYALQIRVEQLIKVLEATQKELDEAKSRIKESADYKILKEKVDLTRRNVAKLPGDPDFIKECQQAEENLENFTQGIIKLVEEIYKIPLNSERGKTARNYFAIGDYQAARDALDEKEMGKEKHALLKKGEQLKKQNEEHQAQCNDLAADYILKAKLVALAYQLGDARIPQARQCFEEALELGRTPERLFEYALFLQKNNQFSDSEAYYQEALTIHRELAQTNPAVYRPAVATTLNNLGNLVAADSDRRKEAEAYYQEALTISRELAQTNPAVYRPDVARTLNNLGILVAADSDRRKEAEAYYQEALTISRELAQTNPAVYRHAVAMTLNSLGYLIAHDNSRFDQAEALLQESLRIARNYSENNPTIFISLAPQILDSLGFAYINNQRPTEALPYLQEAIELFTELAEQAPSVYGKYLESSKQLFQQAENAK